MSIIPPKCKPHTRKETAKLESNSLSCPAQLQDIQDKLFQSLQESSSLRITQFLSSAAGAHQHRAPDTKILPEPNKFPSLRGRDPEQSEVHNRRVRGRFGCWCGSGSRTTTTRSAELE